MYRSAVLLGLSAIQLAAATTVIRGVTLIDGTGSPPQPRTTIVIRGERIAEIGPSAKVRIPKGARIIDANGRFAVPGLWDMHVHLWYAQNQLPVYIAHGITGVRDMGSDFARTSAWRTAVESGQAIGPHVVTPGPVVDGAPERDAKLPVVVAATPEDGRRAFDRLDDMHVDFIKVMSRLSRDAYIALAERCRKWRLPFAGHVPAEVSAWDAIEARQASIEHLFGLFAACSSEEAGIRSGRTPASHAVDSFDEAKARELFRRSALMETRQVPTLTLWERMAFVDTDKRVHDPRLKSVAPLIRAGWPKPEQELEDSESDGARQMRRQFELAMRMVKMMQQAGVEIMAGTDTGDPYTIPGATLHRELELLVKAGLTPMQAIQTATVMPARFLGWDESMGVLKRGMVADIVILDADPLADIRNISRVSGVAVRGRYLPKSWISATVAAVK